MDVDVGLWAADGTAVALRAGHARRLGGSAEQALATFGHVDIIHDNGIWLAHNHQLAELARRRRVPRLVSTRGMLEPWALRHKAWKKVLAWKTYQRKDLARCDLLHATSQSEADSLGRVGLGVQVEIIPNGVAAPELLLERTSSPREHRTALFLGRIYPVKGLTMLVDAWARSRPPGWRLCIAGPDEAGHRRDVERRIREAGLADFVCFLGPVEGEAKAMAYMNADLFVLPSYSESFGMAVAEALSYGLPVLTTTAVPWPELETELCGWRASATVSDLSAALAAATSTSAGQLVEMGERGRRLVRSQYEWGPVARRFLDLYKELVDRGSSGASSIPRSA
jgi:glycosyltransferase involved in cell wall biosynthesis